MTSLTDHTDEILSAQTQKTLVELASKLTSENHRKIPILGFQLNHHESVDLFSLTILLENCCFTLYLRNQSEIQLYFLNFADNSDAFSYLFDKIHDGGLFGDPLVVG